VKAVCYLYILKIYSIEYRHGVSVLVIQSQCEYVISGFRYFTVLLCLFHQTL